MAADGRDRSARPCARLGVARQRGRGPGERPRLVGCGTIADRRLLAPPPWWQGTVPRGCSSRFSSPSSCCSSAALALLAAAPKTTFMRMSPEARPAALAADRQHDVCLDRRAAAIGDEGGDADHLRRRRGGLGPKERAWSGRQRRRSSGKARRELKPGTVAGASLCKTSGVAQ